MINFENYLRSHNCTPLTQTEQSKTFLVEYPNIKRVCKKFPSQREKEVEENAYKFVKKTNLLKVPSITCVGEDFLEIEFLNKLREPEIREIVEGVSRLYLFTINNQSGLNFPVRDLSKNKLISRISYLDQEFEKRKIRENNLLSKFVKFIEGKYNPSPHKCVIHGDLKSPHVIPSKEDVFYIDLGLMSIASPWYDLAFLYMEKSNKDGFLEKLIKISHKTFGEEFGVEEQEIKDFLISGIFYRCLYNLGFALRHRPIKTVERTIKELNEIINTT
jgi:hypothetical protein